MSTHIHSTGDLLIDRYEVVKYLDEGGMQQVYVAKDGVFGRHVALKVPKNPSAAKRFDRSARMSAKVIHGNVAKTLDYFEFNGRSYLIEELIEGQTLSEKLEKEFDILDLHLAAHLIHNLAKGVAASHHVGVFHRDLKPSNILVSREPDLKSVKITDFGIAKMAKEEMVEAFKDRDSITGSLTAMGALPYMAPEMITDQKSADLPADIWALGAMLYQMISGKPPFGRGLNAAVSIVTAKIPTQPVLFAMKPQFRPLTDNLWDIVTACLQKGVADRPSADQLVEMCEKLCYSCTERRIGSIQSFGGTGRGQWGFIDVDGDGRVFFHRDSFYGENITVGDKVSFASFPGVPQPRVFPVLPLKP